MIGVSLSAMARTASSSGFEPGLESEIVRAAKLKYLLDDLPLLIDLDRVNAAVATLITVLADGGVEGLMQFAQAMLQNVREADENRQRDAAPLKRVDELV